MRNGSQPKVRKTIRVAALIEALGEQEAEKLLTVIAGLDGRRFRPGSTLTKLQLERGMTLVGGNGRVGDRRAHQAYHAAAAAPMRMFLAQDPRRRSAFLAWCQERLDSGDHRAGRPDVVEQPLSKRPRRTAAASPTAAR